MEKLKESLINPSESIRELSILELLNRSLSELGSDHKANINKLVSLCGKTLGAFSVVYNNYIDNQLNTVGKFIADNTIEKFDFETCDICSHIVTDISEKPIIIENLKESDFAKTNSFINKLDLHTYIGKPIVSEGKIIGTLCLFYQNSYLPSEELLRVLSIIGLLIGYEDKRMRDDEVFIKKSNRYRILLEASAKASQALISNIYFEQAVNDVLEIIGDASEQDRAYIFEFHKDVSTGNMLASQRFERVKQGISTQIDNSKLQNMPVDAWMSSWYSQLSKGFTIKGNISDFTEKERSLLEPQGIISMLGVPIFVDNICWGFIGLDNCREEYNWTETELNILQNISSALGLYIFRNIQRLELILAKEQAEESEIYANSLFEQSPQSILYIYSNGVTEKVNKSFDSLFKIPKEKFIGKFNILNHPKSKALGWDEIFRRSLNGENEFISHLTYDPVFFGHTGEVKYLNCISFPIRFKGRVKKVAVMFQDVTSLKKYEEELKAQNRELKGITKELKKSYSSLEMAKSLAEEKETKYKTILENSFNLIGQFSLDGTFLYYNRVYSDVLGYDQNELLGTNGFLLFHPEDMDRIKTSLCHDLPVNNEVKLIARVRTKSGAYKLIDHKFRLLKADNEKENTMLLSSQDITEQNRNEMLLQIQRNLAFSINTCKSFNEFYAIINKEINTIIPVNNLFVSFFDEKTGMFSLGCHNDEKDDFEIWPAKGSLTGYTLSKNEPIFVYKKDILHLHEIGEIDLVGTMAEVWLGVPFTSENGVQGAIVIQNYDDPNAFNETDIEIVELIANEIKIFVDKKNAEESTLKLTKAVTESPASVVITDANGQIEYINPKFTSLTGYSFDEVIGLNPRILKSGFTPDSQYQNLWKTITSGKEWRGEIQNKKKNGDFYWEDVSISPIFDDDGKITHYIAVKEDISDRKVLINQLIVARDRAEESDRLKTAFLQNISHEIRTPMNGIMGFIELLKDPEITGEEQTQYFDIIEKSSQRMLSTINDIIDISKIEAGVVKITKSEIRVNQLVSEVVYFFRPEAEKKGMTINLYLDKSVDELVIYSDLEKVFATLSNLIKNAIKYSVKGVINVGSTRKEGYVEFFVQDSGIGIDKSKLGVIFERFIQAESESIRSYEGAGLGLSIVKAYIELLGGKIYVESELGIGSKFTFTIPTNTAFEVSDANFIEESKNNHIYNVEKMSRSTKILIAEDEETNAIYLKTILRQTDYNLFFAKTGKEAVEIFDANRDIKVILMDIRMPEMDGFQATKLIKEMNANVVVIAQTAYAFEGDKEKALELGCDNYLSKPIRKEDLLEMLRKYI